MPVIDFEITANRPDCLSVVGIAREASAIWRTAAALPDSPTGTARWSGGRRRRIDVRLEEPELCPRYCAQVFDVDVGPSPAWLPNGSRPPASGRSATSSTSPTT